MKQVITLIGRDAGQAKWMRSHEADAAVATGVAAWPDDPKVAHFRARLGLDAPALPLEYRPLAVRWVNGANVLVGEWPKRLALEPRILAANFVTHHESGVIHIRLGDATATYRAVRDPRDGRILADLVSIDEPKVAAPAPAAVETAPPAPPPPDIAEEFIEEVAKEAAVDASSDAAPVSHETIPHDWRKMHWKHRIQLATTLSGRAITDISEANAIIQQAKEGGVQN